MGNKGVKGNEKPTTENQKEEIKFPTVVDYGPYKVWVFYHISGGSQKFNCWSYVSEGLNEFKHKEVILTVKQEDNEKPQDVPAMPFQLFNILYQYASKGTIVAEGETTRFGENGFLGVPNIRGLAYVPSHLIENGINLAHNRTYMYAVTLSQEEIFIAMEYGTPRVMSMIGQQTTYYPYPLWSDRKRPNVVSEVDKPKIKDSILSKVNRISLLNSSVIYKRNENKLVFKIPSKEGATKLKTSISNIDPKHPIAFLVEYDFSVNGHLVWTPSDPSKISGITPDTDTSGKELIGSFIVFCPEQPQIKISIVEDGFFAILTDQSWTYLRDSLINGKPFSLKSDTPDGFDLEILWISEEFLNPVDGQVYVAPGGWKIYGPSETPSGEKKVEKEKAKTPIDLSNIVLLNDENHIQSVGLNADALVEFVKDITDTLERIFTNLRPNSDTDFSKFELHLQIMIRVGSVGSFAMKTIPEGKLEAQEITTIDQALSPLSFPTISRDTVSILLSFSVKIPALMIQK